MLIFQSICARSTDIRRRRRKREREREQENKVVAIHCERIRDRERESKEKHRFLFLFFLFFFYLIMYIQSLITTVVFPICQCRISRSFSFVELILFIIRVFQVMEKIRRQWWQWILFLSSSSYYSSFPTPNNLI